MKKQLLIILALVMVLTVAGAGKGKTVQAAEVDARNTAETLAFSDSWGSERWFTNDNSEHWYKLIIPSDGCVELKIMSYISGTYYELYDQDLSKELYSERIYDGSEVQPGTKYTDYVLSQGIYYMKISSGNSGRYKLSAGYKSYGTNDGSALSYDSPQNYELGSQIVGAITATDGEDWYRLVIPQAGYYIMNIKSYIGYCMHYDLYNQDLSTELYSHELYRGSELQPKTDNTEYILNEGIYYLKISQDSSNASNRGKYIYTLSGLSEENCNHDYTETLHQSTYLTKGYTLHVCKKCGKSYKDNYQSKKVLSQGYIWSCVFSPEKKRITVSYHTISDVSGYQIRYSTSKKFRTSVKTVRAGKSTTAKILKGMKKGKRYYVQVRGYKKVRGRTIYGKWSAKRNVKTY